MRTVVSIGADQITGVRNADDPASPALIDDRWHLGSDTKAMTATLVAIHIDRGELRLDDTIATLFAGVTIDPGYATVTLEELPIPRRRADRVVRETRANL